MEYIFVPTRDVGIEDEGNSLCFSPDAYSSQVVRIEPLALFFTIWMRGESAYIKLNPKNSA